jgi:hypothetical protein
MLAREQLARHTKMGSCFLYDQPDSATEGKLKDLGEPEFNTLSNQNRLPTHADSAARAELERAAP